MVKTILTLSMIVLILRTSAFARDPHTPQQYEYEDYQSPSGGDGKWEAGDTFLAITIPATIVGVIILLNVYGEPEDSFRWPVYKFANYERSFKFPTRSTCIDSL